MAAMLPAEVVDLLVLLHKLLECCETGSGAAASFFAGASRGQNDRNDSRNRFDICPSERSSIDYIAQQSDQGNLTTASQQV
jgi:hypothetical protein